MNAIRLSMIAAVALTLTACGGAKLGGGKQGAAEALFQASGPASSARGAAARLYTSGATSVETKVQGQKSGSVTLSIDTSSTSNIGDLAMTLKYDNFSDDGKNYYSGQMTMTMHFDFNITDTTASGSVALTMKGRVDISGEISDFVDADVTETVAFNALKDQSGTVSIKLNGTIATSSESYVYTNEEVTFTADHDLPKDDGSGSTGA